MLAEGYLHRNGIVVDANTPRNALIPLVRKSIWMDVSLSANSGKHGVTYCIFREALVTLRADVTDPFPSMPNSLDSRSPDERAKVNEKEFLEGRWHSIKPKTNPP
jgi:hypothetical protein